MSVKQKSRGATLRDVARSEFAGGELFQRRHRHDKHPHDIAHTLGYLARLIAGANDNGGGHGGAAVRLDGETLELATKAQSRDTPRLYVLQQSYCTRYYGE